jgi:uroporphyrin-III C-methyltransferase
MTVYLVGAGPGDPELLTLKAARLLGAAEVVVYDRLINPALLSLAPKAELIDVGKVPGLPLGQDLINALLVHLASEHHCVVRLKGGDPFVFGRGGEEAQALAEAGLDYEVVPGISSAIAAPASAGVPVTHRGLSAAFTVVTGHRGTKDGPAIDWDALARVGGTIVVVMGVAQRADIAASLIVGGLSPDTPVMVVRNGTHSDQSDLRTTLSLLGSADVESPATIVIGAVAELDLRHDRDATDRAHR